MPVKSDCVYGEVCRLIPLLRFDLWLTLRVAQIPPDDILSAFEPYRPETFTATTVIANGRAKLADRGFHGDIEPLSAELPAGYDIDGAAELVTDALLARL